MTSNFHLALTSKKPVGTNIQHFPKQAQEGGLANEIVDLLD
jgi:hypothetical protein